MRWGQAIAIAGQVQGRAVSRITVAVERQDFPFSGPFSSVGVPPAKRADGAGRFRFTVGPLFSTTTLRVVTRTAIVVSSPVVRARVAVKVGLIERRRRGGGTLLRGSVTPEAPDGRASLQRRSRVRRQLDPGRAAGRCARSAATARATPSACAGSGATAPTASSSSPLDGGAHVTGRSREVRVEGRG